MIIYQGDTKKFEDQCAYIWFPNEGHAELEVDSRIHNLFCGSDEVHSGTELERRERSLAGTSAPYFRFQIGITAREKDRIIEEMGRLGIQTCSGNVAAVLRKVTGVTLPRISSMFPSRLSAHLYQTCEASDSRINRIEYVGELFRVNDVNELWEDSQYKSRIIEYVMILILVYYVIVRMVEIGNRLQCPREE